VVAKKVKVPEVVASIWG